MAAGRRDAEGIALLSVVYGDLDSDDDLEDAAASPPPLTTAIPGDGEAAGSSIVDYAHDEAAASPEHEERETVGDGDDMQVDNGQGLFCLSGKELTPSRDEGEAETSVVQDSLDNSVNPHTAEQDPLAGFLPSPPHTLCSDELKIWCVLLTTFANSRRHLERRNVEPSLLCDWAGEIHQVFQVKGSWKKLQ